MSCGAQADVRLRLLSLCFALLRNCLLPHKNKTQVGLYLDEQAKAHEEATGQPWDISWEVDPRNTGMINVYFPPPSDGGPADGSSA
jgi:hypothetical protein